MKIFIHLCNNYEKLKREKKKTFILPPTHSSESLLCFRKSYININQNDLNAPNRVMDMDTNSSNEDHQVPHPLKSREDLMNDVRPSQRSYKSNISPSPLKSKRGTSLTRADVELPVDYRQYLRHTDQGAYLYGEKQQRTSLEHSLGYFP